MTRTSTAALAAVGLLALAGAWLMRHTAATSESALRPAPPPSTPASAVILSAPPAPASAPAAPAIEHPIETVQAQDAAPLAPEGVGDALAELVGRKAVQGFFVLDDFPRRVVATVDALGRVHASSRLWPLQPTPERFIVRGDGPAHTIDPDNGLRYAPAVLLLEATDMGQAAGLYKRMYPLLQQAYEDLGYPHRYFNDRMVAVIDLLLATPEPTGPLQVLLPELKGPTQPTRPWVLYQFADPTLESLAAGQKILLRMGPVNERRVKARLAEFRRLIAAH